MFFYQHRQKCDDHDHCNIDGHVDILKIGGRSSVEAKVGNEGSHNFLIVVAMSVRSVCLNVALEFLGVICLHSGSILGFFENFGRSEGSAATF